MAKNPPANAGDIRDRGLIPGSGRSPGEGKDNPLQYSCLKNPMDRGAGGRWSERVGHNPSNLAQHPKSLRKKGHTVFLNQVWKLK